MNRLLLLFLFPFFLFSCKKQKKTAPILNEKESVEVIQKPPSKQTSMPVPIDSEESAIIDTGLQQPIDSISRQFSILELDTDDFKQQFNESEVLKAYSWKDIKGENTLVITRKGPIVEKNSEWGDGRSASLYAVQYLNGTQKKDLLWDIYDFEKDCGFDLWIGLVPNSLRITDLDKDGISETTLVYKKNCRSDYSPAQMKLIMHEGERKMALRGLMFLALDKEAQPAMKDLNLENLSDKNMSEYDKILLTIGRYKSESAFANQPSEFLSFARKHWIKNTPKDQFLQFYGNKKIIAPTN